MSPAWLAALPELQSVDHVLAQDDGTDYMKTAAVGLLDSSAYAYFHIGY